MALEPPATEVGLVFESLEASSRVPQLEAGIAQLKDALPRRQQIGGDRAAGPALAHHPERAWSLLVRVSQTDRPYRLIPWPWPRACAGCHLGEPRRCG